VDGRRRGRSRLALLARAVLAVLAFLALLAHRSVRRPYAWGLPCGIEFADRLGRHFQLLIIAQPAAYHRNHLAAQTELSRASTAVAHRENRQPMTFAAHAFAAPAGVVADRPLQQRAAQDLAGHWQERTARRGSCGSCAPARSAAAVDGMVGEHRAKWRRGRESDWHP
jgi:hypothetical protein